MPIPLTNRRGSAILWALLLVAIITTLAAVIAVSLGTSTKYNDAVATAQVLDDLSVSINTFETNVHSATGATTNNFPGLLSELTNRVRLGQLTSCSTTAMTARDSQDWVNNGGPFLTQFYIDTTGLMTPMGHINDRVQRAGNNAPGTNPIFLVIPDMDIHDAKLLNRIVDNGVNNGGNNDTLQFDSTQADTVTVLYRVTPRQNNKC